MIDSFTTERANTKSWFYKLTKEKFFAALLKEVSMGCKNAVSTELLSKNLWVNSLTFDIKTTLMKEIQSVITEKYDFEYRDKSLIKVPFYFSDLQKIVPRIKRKKLPFCPKKQNFSIETTTKKEQIHKFGDVWVWISEKTHQKQHVAVFRTITFLMERLKRMIFQSNKLLQIKSVWLRPPWKWSA